MEYLRVLLFSSFALAENFHDEPKLRVRSQNGDAVQTMSVITLLFCLCCGTRSVLLVSRQFHNDEKDCSLEWPNRATAAPGSVPALPSMINLVYDACGRVAVVPLTKTPCQLLRYSTKTLKQPVHQIPSAPSFCCLSDVAFLRCGLGWHGGFLSRRASHVLTEFHWLLCGNNLVDFFNLFSLFSVAVENLRLSNELISVQTLFMYSKIAVHVFPGSATTLHHYMELHWVCVLYVYVCMYVLMYVWMHVCM